MGIGKMIVEFSAIMMIFIVSEIKECQQQCKIKEDNPNHYFETQGIEEIANK